ncbi:hypothetical protein S40285_04548 [Stachybotrys chlorohalonatus IBT 40285]|uniref:Uncharacterized protein n=1 Tax=Stachybotrys chlorohalonatus (strain IBT 40285) TaxID=1283841 RepID=A0A084QC18_STAC4|nr:hypothetical protein S40285_04548 [Stachybotrys chlorohalonata IBT 40285]
MPGRQAHGRSLTAAPKAKTSKKSKARSQKNALNAFGIAQEQFPARFSKTPRARELDAEIERKHGRDEDDEDEDEEEEAPRRKKAKAPARNAGNDDAEYGSDSEGNEWRLGGLAPGDEDSEIESDDAFGDSDEDKFQGYSFAGSKSTKDHDDDTEDDENDDEGQTLGEDAIDLATALDQYEETSEEEQEEISASDEEESDEEESDESDMDDDDEEGEEEANPEQLEALKGLISGFGGDDADEANKNASVKQKLSLSDLGLTGLNDPLMKKSVKLMGKEEKAARPGTSKKLAVPLARRQQGRLDRSAAYEKTNETLNRWNETVKQNRRAEHLVFPLPQNSATAGLDTTEMLPLTTKNAGNELESTIMSIMEQSGLSLEKEAKPRKEVFDEDGNLLSRKDVQNLRRKERELNSREAKRAKRIKKIKSKAFHRVHRKERERAELAEGARKAEAGELDSEEEREAQDRRRALERVGQRHKESKWAKIGAKAKRAVWDEDFRAGLTEMARKDQELRRRKEGKAGGSDDDSETSSDGDSDDGEALQRQLDRLEQGDGNDDDEPHSKLMGLKFMQKAEAAHKKANDDLIQEIRKTLDENSEIDPEEDKDEDDGGEVGRRQYGVPGSKPIVPALDTSTRAPKARTSDKKSLPSTEDASAIVAGPQSGAWSRALVSKPAPVEEPVDSTSNPWTRTASRPKKGSASARNAAVVSSNNSINVPERRSKAAAAGNTSSLRKDSDASSDSDEEADQHLPLAIRDQELVSRAFASEDVVADFQREKEEVAEAEGDKVIDNTLPGWGSWVGDGVSSREKKRHQGRFLTTVEGVKKNKRQDAKLDKVIINEKRIKKNSRYLASQLPHEFETKEQYERSLRLPVGREWMTKETFQESTKPRLLVKPGIITAMSKPMA